MGNYKKIICERSSTMFPSSLRSSLGFHTMALSIPIFKQETKQLISDFKKYSEETGSIQMYSDQNENTVIKFLRRNRGIEWRIRYNVWMNGFEQFCDIIDVKINPKILAGENGYITAASYGDMNVAIFNFNSISKEISPLLRTFDEYSLNRIDYCINFYLPELIAGYTVEQLTKVMRLIKRSDIPSHYREWMTYDEKAHRMKSRDGSFYLICDSVTINCYSKYMKYQEQSAENVRKGYPPISQEIMEAAQGILRFEVQCKYPKIYALSQQAEKAGNCNINKYGALLTPEVCENIVKYYFKKTVGMGDWYMLQEAVKTVESNFNRQKADRLIRVLQEVNQCRSLAKAKAKYQGDDLAVFKLTLKDLSDIGINPVTIPKEWEIMHIPNLMRAYESKKTEESIQNLTELMSF